MGDRTVWARWLFSVFPTVPAISGPDSGEKPAHRDQDVADEAALEPRVELELARGDRRAADQEDERPGIDERAHQTDPLPLDDAAREAVRFGEGRIDGGDEDRGRRQGDHRDPEAGPAIGALAPEVQIGRALSEGIPAQEGARHVPEPEHRLVPSHQARVGLGESTHAVSHHPDAPPEQMGSGALLRKPAEEDDGEERGAERGDDGKVQNGLMKG